MIYEIRDYTIEEQWFERYVYWAKNHFMPYAKKRINVIDFWIYNGIGAEIEGKNPIVSPNGQPNITWVAEYENKEEREIIILRVLRMILSGKMYGKSIQIQMLIFTKTQGFLNQ